MPSVRRSRESQIGQSLGQRALSSSRTDRAFLWSGKSKPAPKMGHRREKVGVSALWALVSPQLAEIWSAIRFDLAPGYTASPPRSVDPERNKPHRLGAAGVHRELARFVADASRVRAIVLWSRSWGGSIHPAVCPRLVEIVKKIDTSGERAERGALGPDPDEFGQYETGPAPPAHQPSRYIGASNAPSNDRLAR